MSSSCMLKKEDLEQYIQDERFKIPGLLEIYAEAQSTRIERLMDVALAKYPDCMDVGKKPIYVTTAAGRAFEHNGKFEQPEYFIGGWMSAGVFIMRDGTAYPAY